MIKLIGGAELVAAMLLAVPVAASSAIASPTTASATSHGVTVSVRIVPTGTALGNNPDTAAQAGVCTLTAYNPYRPDGGVTFGEYSYVNCNVELAGIGIGACFNTQYWLGIWGVDWDCNATGNYDTTGAWGCSPPGCPSVFPHDNLGAGEYRNHTAATLVPMPGYTCAPSCTLEDWSSGVHLP